MKGLKLLGNVARQAWLLLMAVAMLVIMLPVTSYAEENAVDTVIYWKVEEVANGDGSFDTVLFLGNNNTDEEMAGAESWDMTEYNTSNAEYGKVGWHAQRNKVTRVKVVSEITPARTSYWFYSMYSCSTFDIEKLDTSQVKNMRWMFSCNSSVTSLKLGDFFDTSHVTNMDSMFDNCSKLETLDLGNSFDTASVTNMRSMFGNCSKLAQLDFGEKFDTSNVTDMSSMFRSCSKLESLDLSGWNTKNVTNMSYMFIECEALKTLTLDEYFDTSNVTNMSYMFSQCRALQTLEFNDSFNTSNVTNMIYMFSNCESLETLVFGNTFDVSKVTSMERVFSSCKSLETLTFNEAFDTSNVTNMNNMFFGCINLKELNFGEGFQTSNVKNMNSMFRNCESITDITFFKQLDTSNVTDMGSLFAGCDGLSIDTIPEWFDTSNVTSMNNMFWDCKGLKIFTFPEWFDTTKVTTMFNMFNGCTGLTTFTFAEGFDASGLKNMQGFFSGCTSLQTVNFGENIDTSNVTSIYGMFYNCDSLVEFDLTRVNTQNVSSIGELVASCSNLRKLDISTFDLTKVNSYIDMFAYTDICILKTPAVNGLENKISLRNTYYEESDLSTPYKYLPVTTGTSKTLYRGNTITYNLDGGEVATENPVLYLSGEEGYTIELCTPTKEGYYFNGWVITKPSTCTLTVNGSTVNIPKYTYGDVTLKASWKSHTHCICDAGSCKGNHNSTQQWIPWMDAKALPDTEGYYYLIADVTLDTAWEPKNETYLCLNGHSVVNEKGSAIVVLEDTNFYLTDCDSGDSNCISGGIRNEGSLNIGGGLNIVGSGVYLPAGKTISIRGVLDTKARIYVTMEVPGAVTSGWSLYMSTREPSDYFISSDSRYGATLADGEVQLAGAYAINVEDMVHGTVTVDKTAVDGLTVAEGVPVELTVKPDTGYELTDIKVVKKGDSTTEVPLTNKSSTTYTFDMPAYDVVVSAEFTIKTYTIKFLPGADGVGEPLTVTKTYGETIVMPGALYTRTGYVQYAWSTNENGSYACWLNADWTGNADKTFYPAWKAYLTGTAVIEGPAKAGETLTASLVDSNATGTYKYQWYRDKTALSGATAKTYTTTKKDVGYPIKCEISTYNQEGVIVSAPTAIIEMQEFLSDEITITGYNGVYDGAEHGITIELPEHLADATISYGTSEGVYDLSESPTYSRAGGYYVYYRITKENYAPMTGVVHIGISRVKLTVEAFDETVTYGDSVPEYRATVSGFINDETESVISGKLSFACAYEQNSDVGQYIIEPYGLSADNYYLHYDKAKLTVEPKTVNVTWGNNEFVYNSRAQKPEVSTTDFVAGDDVCLVVDGAQTSANAEDEYYTAAVRMEGEDAGNYVFAEDAVTYKTFTISKADPEIGTVGYTGEVTEGTKPEDVVLTRTDLTVAGKLELTDEILQSGQNIYHWKFTPSGGDARNYSEITGTVNITVQSVLETPGTGDGGDKEPEQGTGDGGDKEPEQGTGDGGDKEPEQGTGDGGDKEPEQGTGDGGDKEPEQGTDDGGDKEPEGGDDKEPEGGDDKEPEGGDDKEPEGGDDKEPEGGDDKEPEGGDDKEPEDGDDKEPEGGDDKEPEGGDDKEPEQGTDDGSDKQPEIVPEVGLKIKLANPETGYVYTGSAIKPELIVTNNGVELQEGVDYTIKYSNNVKASTSQKPAKITVKGKGNLSGSVTASFMILPKNIADEDVIGGKIVVLSGAKANPILVYKNKKLTAKDFTNPNAKVNFMEDGTITITGKGNFTGTRTMNVDVVDKSELKKFTVTVGTGVLTYNGKEQKPTITVADESGAVLTEGVDYAISYGSSLVDAGTVKFTVVGLGYYTGTVTKSYKIMPLATADMKVSGICEEGYYYVGSGVTFDENFKVICEATGEVLRVGKDYKIAYNGNKKVGTAKYTISFLGNYKGSAAIKGTFAIKAMPLSNNTAGLKVVIGDMAYNGKANIYKSVPLVSINGVALKTSDYTVTYYKDAELTNQITGKNKVALGENEDSFTIYVKIVGKKNYASAQGEFVKAQYKVTRMATYDLSKARVTFWDGNTKLSKVEYTGKEVKPTVKVECKVNGVWQVVPAERYEVMYTNNINKGTASVVVNATGSDCAGSKTAKFKIVSKDINFIADLLKDLFGI